MNDKSVEMTETLTFDQEEALVRGQIPLNEFKVSNECIYSLKLNNK